jgi:hypothetical protein
MAGSWNESEYFCGCKAEVYRKSDTPVQRRPEDGLIPDELYLYGIIVC